MTDFLRKLDMTFRGLFFFGGACWFFGQVTLQIIEATHGR